MTKKNLPEDMDLFRSAIGKVKPVKADKIVVKPLDKPKPYPKTRHLSMDDALTSRANGIDINTVGIEDTLSFTASDAPKNVLKQLRQGYFAIDAEIDLHGLSSDSAKKHMLKFLHECVVDGCQCVHIVHGKGYRSFDNYPILKNNLNLWLRQHQDVQAFCSASPKDGGSGAVLVLLYLSEKYLK